MKYPNVQEVDSIDITVASWPSPNTAPTTTGIKLKKPPEPMPLRIAKTISKPSDEENGQSANVVKPITVSASSMLLTGPSRTSAPNPMPIRPRAEAKFQDARIAAPVWPERPTDET